ncbi:MAG: ribonuclease III [Candidatus Omnitrophica bacterium]|nr:ribonuclease III [Candidatus Omnitrophota bacterium]MCM8807182.1 ribonuclease III [Candidatus Omnitrophota bacterium]
MQKLEKLIKYSFKNKKLLEKALTHPSFSQKDSYERLEFLGDLILDVIVGIYLYKKYKNEDVEFLTNLKSAYVNKRYLKKIADKIGLIKFSKYKGGIIQRTDKFLEALIGAIYLDSGWKNVEKFIKKFILNEELEPLKDYKNLIFDYAIKTGKNPPEYKISKIEGPPHKRKFEVKVKIKGIRKIGKGIGQSIKEAEIEAAKSLYKKIFEMKN